MKGIKFIKVLDVRLIMDVNNSGNTRYNFFENALTYGSALIGAVTPILAVRYGAGLFLNPEGWKEELATWGASILVNCFPIPTGGYVEDMDKNRVIRRKRNKAPIIGLTTMVGMFIGDIFADNLRINRRDKQEISGIV
jgi:hypothetical protein